MKCDKCGFTPNIGDQICMNCGAKLSIENSSMPGVDAFKNTYQKTEKKKNIKIITLTILGIIIFTIITFLIIKYIVL